MAKGKKKSIEEWKEELAALAEEKKWEELLSASEVCVKEHPNKSVGYFSMGIAEDELGNWEASIAHYGKALEFETEDKKKAYIHSNRGRPLRELKRYEEAIAGLNSAIDLDPKNVDLHHNRAITIAEKQADAQRRELQEEHEKRLKKLDSSYDEFRATEIIEIYGDEIEKIEKKLEDSDTKEKLKDGDIDEKVSIFNKIAKLLVRHRRFYSPLSLLFVFMFFASLYVEPPSCYEGILSHCLLKGILYSPWFWLGMIAVIISSKAQNMAGIGLWTKARETAAHLRLVFVLVFITMTQIYFEVFDLGMRSVRSTDETVNFLRYVASVIFVISPFIFYYRHINNRANQLHILQLSLHRERNNLLFWIAEKSNDINSPKFLLAKEILNHSNKNGAADIGVRMLNPKLDEGRRWSLFGFGGKALSELEDKLEDLTDVIKRLELREPKQEEDKQKTKGNDTDVGATTDNK